jgi:predicted HTH transcriptional regulator
MPAIPTSDMPGHRELHGRVHAALDTCVESQAIDFKESAPWDGLRYKIIKSAMAMGNLRDGGAIIIGAGERGSEWDLSGITDEDLATYKVDEIIDSINRYASPPMAVQVVVVQYRSERFLVINVREFAETPFVCKKNGPDGSGLRQAALYVRPPGMAKTTQIRAAEELHDLLNLAAEKRARSIIETARRIGLEPGPLPQPFDDELGGL